jgi:hypothetical protein
VAARRQGAVLPGRGPQPDAVSIDSDGQTLRAGQAQALFAVDVAEPNPPYPNRYTVSGDGERIAVNAVLDQPAGQSLTVLVNWQQALNSSSPTP